MVLAEGGGEEGFVAWFARAFWLVRVGKEEDRQRRHEHSRRSCTQRSNASDTELCFLQYFEAMKDTEMSSIRIGECLNCISLRWLRDDGKKGQVSA